MGLGNELDRKCTRLFLSILRTCIEEFNKTEIGSDHCKDWTEEQIRELKITTGEGALEQIEHIKKIDKTAGLTVMMLYHDDLVRIKRFLKDKEL